MTEEPEVVPVDERGRRCPLPVITLARVMAEVPVGSVVRLLSDDPAAASDVAAWCDLKGQAYLGEVPLDPDDPAAGLALSVRRTS